jgi:hypothetical protein
MSAEDLIEKALSDGRGALDQIQMLHSDDRRIMVKSPAAFDLGPARIYSGTKLLATLTIIGWEPIQGGIKGHWIRVAPPLPDTIKAGDYLIQLQ